MSLQQPKVRLASKFERQVDRRTFVDKKGLYDGVSYLSDPIQTPTIRNHCVEKNQNQKPNYSTAAAARRIDLNFFLIFFGFND